MSKNNHLIDEINAIISRSKKDIIKIICNEVHGKETRGTYYLTDLVITNLLSIYTYYILSSTEDIGEKAIHYNSNIENIEDISKCIYFNESLSYKEYLLNNFGFLQPKMHYEYSIKNNMTELTLISRFKIFLYKKICKYKKKSYSGLPMIACSHFLDVFQEKFFFLRHLEMYISPKKLTNRKNNKRYLLSKVLEKHKFCELISKLSALKKIDSKILDKKLNQFLLDFFPISHLENLINNLNIFVLETKKYSSKYVISEGEGTSDQYFAIASAFDLGKKVIRYIHGGSALYLKGNENSLSIMFPYTDLLIVFSKSAKYPKEIMFNHFSMTRLPNPWLSEKFKKNKVKINKSGKILYLPMMIKPMPAFPFGSGYSLPEDKNLILSYISDFLKYSKIKNHKIEVKPFNGYSNELLKKRFGNENIIYGNSKSLSISDYKKYSCIVYDTPGTGFLECIASNFPVYLIWDKKITINYSEFDHIFEILEKSNILFHNFKDFFNSYEPNINFFTADRVEAYDVVKNALCDIDLSWETYWIDFFNRIKYESN